MSTRYPICYYLRVTEKRKGNNSSMISSIPNPKMTEQEVKSFRLRLSKVAAMSFSMKERKAIKNKIMKMERIANNVIKNNGGKNPILGY